MTSGLVSLSVPQRGADISDYKFPARTISSKFQDKGTDLIGQPLNHEIRTPQREKLML